MEDVERYLALPVLGVIAQRAGLLSRGEANMAHVEAYRMLRTNIEFATEGGGLRSLCILSAGAGEGKSMTIANLAFIRSIPEIGPKLYEALRSIQDQASAVESQVNGNPTGAPNPPPE